MNNLLYRIEDLSIFDFVKVLIVVGVVVYVFFSYLMLRQVKLMNRVISVRDEYLLKILGTAHFAFAILVLFITLITL